MPPDVVDRDQRLLHGQCGSFGEVYPHQNSADQAGSIGHSHGVNVASGQLRLLQSLIRQAIDGFNMLAGRDFRDHAAVDPVQVHLRRNAVAQNLPTVPDDGHGSLITGGFNG